MKLLSLIFLGSLFCTLTFANVQSDTLFTPDKSRKGLTYYEVLDSTSLVVAAGKLLNGKKNGVIRSYNAKNTLIRIEEYSEGVLDGIVLICGDNGAIETEENYRKGILHGKRVQYRFGGIKKVSEIYVNGKLDGKRIVFYDNGFRQEEGMYQNGLRHGVSYWYNQSETLTISYTYGQGKLNGPAKTYHYNGKIKSEGNYFNDLEEGEWKEYDEQGKLIKTLYYQAGQMLPERTK